LKTLPKPNFLQGVGLVFLATAAYSYFQPFSADKVQSVSAKIEANIVQISSQTSGVVQSIYSAENNFISKGDGVASIDPSDLKAKLIETQAKGLDSRAKIKFADADIALIATQANAVGSEFLVVSSLLDKAQSAYDKSPDDVLASELLVLERESRSLSGRAAELIAQKDKVEMSKGSAYAEGLLVSAQMGLLMAETKKYQIDSPVTGVVSDVSVKVGQFIEVGDEIATIVDVSDLWVTAYIDEKDIHRIKIGTLAKVNPNSLGDQWLPAAVMSISPVAITQPHSWLPIDEVLVPVKLAVKLSGYLQPGLKVDAVLFPNLVKQQTKP